MQMRTLEARIIFSLVAALLALGSWYNHRAMRWDSIEIHGSSGAEGAEDASQGYPHDAYYGPFLKDRTMHSPEEYYGPGLYMERFVNAERDGMMSHVSSLVPLEGGDMAAAWYSGSREGARDIVVYMSFFRGGKWGLPVPVADRDSAVSEIGQYAKKVGNALLARDSSGRLWLFYSSVVAGGWSGASINCKYSEDEGETWGRSRKLVLSPFFNLTDNLKNKPLALRGGGFLLPVYHEFLKRRSELVLLDPDGWHIKSRITNEGQAIQPSLVFKGGRRLGAFMRNMSDERPRRVLYAESPDMGMTWGPLMSTTLENPDAGLDVVAIDTGLLAVLNNQQEGRHRLTLMHSPDGGRTWDDLRVLEDEPGREFSYPFIARGDDGIFHVTYTYDRKRIKHVSFDRQWLMALIGRANG